MALYDTRLVLSAIGLCLGTAVTVFSVMSGSAGSSLFVATGVRQPVTAMNPRVTGQSGMSPMRYPQRSIIQRAQVEDEEYVEYTRAVPAQASSGLSLPTFGSFLGLFIASLSLVGMVSIANPATAFENAAPEAAQFAKSGKSPGNQPKDLGMLPRKELDGKVGLKECGGAPNCFSTTGPDGKIAHKVAPWLPPAGTSAEDAMKQVKSVVERYPPYQQEVDGGGFKIFTDAPDYLFVQFESLKSGFIDDVEFAINPDGDGILWRSSSRQGYLDQSVNAKRMNWIAAELEKAGWTAPQLTREGYLQYFKQNNLEFF